MIPYVIVQKFKKLYPIRTKLAFQNGHTKAKQQ
jgi:hypothetical protein